MLPSSSISGRPIRAARLMANLPRGRMLPTSLHRLTFWLNKEIIFVFFEFIVFFELGISMDTLMKCNARKHLQEIFYRELAGLSQQGAASAGRATDDFEKIADHVIKVLETDGSAASYVALLNPLPGTERIKTEEVASMLGYSRPYVVALLDSDEFAGKVVKSKGGQRSIRPEEVQAWMHSRGMAGPSKRAERNLLADSPPEFFSETRVSTDVGEAALLRIAQENRDSDEHRPKKRSNFK